MAFRRTSARLLTFGALVLLMLAASASFAFAADPTLGLADLQAKLDASPSGTVSGYFKTVVQGSTIVTIPVEVKGLTGDTPASSLILFEASGPRIETYGGIVAGMSGSPIYVDDEGVDKVIGAVSYGDIFTIGGSGLATPIEAMLQLRSDYPPQVTSLESPVLMDGRVIDRVIVSAHPEKYSVAGAHGAFVARPLSSLFIGGLRPASAAYKHLASAMAKRGVSVVAVETALSAGASSFSTELVPGASVAALATRGDMWIGGMGTVTYADDDTVLAFGHPAFWLGSTNLYMSNAWVTGVWPSQLEPYKMGYPTAIQGTFTQDRSAGILGEVGAAPAETPITSEVTNVQSGHVTTSSVWVTSELLDSGELSGAVGSAASIAAYKQFDSLYAPGSANTTTTIVVSDGVHDYTVVIANLYDDPQDVVWMMTSDAEYAVNSLLSVLSDGLETPHIVSVDLTASLTSARRAARIVGVTTLEPVHPGDNTVRVSMLAYGVEDTQTVDATLTIPEDAPLTGEITASSTFGGDDFFWYGDYYGFETVAERERVAGIVDDLAETIPNNAVTVEYLPMSDDESEDPTDESDGTVSDGPTIEATAATPWVLSDSAFAEITEIDAMAPKITYGQDGYVVGEIYGPTDPVEVSVYAADDEGDEFLVGTGMAESDDGTLWFEVPLDITPRMSSELRVAVDGGLGYTPAETYVQLEVRGRIRLSVSPKTVWRGAWSMFTATVTPNRMATGSVRFQYWDKHDKKWRTLVSHRLDHHGSSQRATCTWSPPARGTWKVRAVYSGNWRYAGSTSSSVTVKVR